MNLMRDFDFFYVGVVVQVDLVLLVGGVDLFVQFVFVYGQGWVYGVVFLGQQIVFVGFISIMLLCIERLGI